MKFKKSCFSIQNIPAAKQRIETVSGYIEETNTYGFYNKGKVWVGVDLASGSYVCTFPTRKKCGEWIEENEALIQKQRETPKYIGFLKSFIENLNESK